MGNINYMYTITVVKSQAGPRMFWYHKQVLLVHGHWLHQSGSGPIATTYVIN